MKKRWWLYFIAGGVLISVLIVIIFGGIYFEYTDMNDVGHFVSPLIGGVLGGIITLIGIELSRAHSEELQEKNRMQEVCLYFVIEVVETMCDGDFDHRFPWGGDPPPSDCFDMFFSNGSSETFRMYFLTRLCNIGYGIGHNIRLHSQEGDAFYISYVAEKSHDFHKIYFVVDCDPFGSIEKSIKLEFEDYLGRKYEQNIELEMGFHDQMMHRCEMISSRPKLRTQANKK